MEKSTPSRNRRYCVAYWCMNSDKKNPDLSFFSLPSNRERRLEWLKLIGRNDLAEKVDLKCKSYAVCSTHFESDQLRVVRHVKNDALPKAVSVSNQPLQKALGCGKKTLGSSAHRQKSETATSPADSNQRLHERLNIFASVMKDPIYICPQDSDDDDVVNNFYKLIDLRNKWEKEDGHEAEFKIFALNLHIYSPHAYKCLKTMLKLPSKKSLLSYKLNIPPYLNDKVLYRLEMKLKSLPDQAKYCIIHIDKFPLQSKIYYDTKADEITGFHSINERKKTEIAKQAIVITIQGIHFNWQQPVTYALLGGGEYFNEIDTWLCNVICKLNGIGFLIKAITSDDSSYFMKFANIKNVTEVNPFIVCNNLKTFYIFDVSYLMVNIRNYLLTSDLCYGSNKISWKYIKIIYQLDVQNKRRLLPKLSSSHIEPNENEKNNIQFAIDSLSRTVSAVLHTYIDLGHITEEARPTALFIENISNLFDLFNSSKHKSENETQSALKMTENQKKVINEFVGMFAAIKPPTKEAETISNFKISIRAIEMLYEDLYHDGFTYLLTRRLSKDSFKTFYEALAPQQSVSYLTPIQFRRKFSKLFLNFILKTFSPFKSCGVDLCDAISKVREVNKFEPEPSVTSAVGLGPETDYHMDLPENDTLVYVSSYLLFKCTKKHKCLSIDRFWDSCRNLNDSNLFDKDLNRKSGFYGSLKIPPIEFIQYIKDLESTITQNLYRIIKKSPGSQLFKLLKTVPAKVPCACFPLTYLLKLFVRLRIYETLKFNNISDSSEKKFLKIKQL